MLGATAAATTSPLWIWITGVVVADLAATAIYMRRRSRRPRVRRTAVLAPFRARLGGRVQRVSTVYDSTPRRGAPPRDQELDGGRRAFEALEIMRRDGVSLPDACSRVGITPALARRHIMPALEEQNESYVARESDELLRWMRVLTVDGPLDLTVRGSSRAGMVARHWDAVAVFLRSGDTTALRRFAGAVVAGHQLLVDPKLIERVCDLADADAVALGGRPVAGRRTPASLGS